MVRADEMREVLAHARDPFEACRELTDRANRAGGHDNITVIVVDFDGAVLAQGPEELAYRKYPLPEAPAADTTARALPVQGQVAAPAPSEEAQRESRRLKVGHTMIGVSFQLPAEGQGQAAGAMPGQHPPDHGPRMFDPGDDSVHIPTNGFPPSVVGFMVLGAMFFVALAGFLLLR